MKEYIEREAALETTYEPFTMSMCMTVLECNGMNRAREMIFKQLRDIPAADAVEVRHAYWAMLSYDEAVCTRCGYNLNTPFDSTREARERWGELPPYCEMCGAKMDGGFGDGRN
jgi:hypothetical protein